MKQFLKKRNEVIPHFPYFVEYTNEKNITKKRVIDSLDSYIEGLNKKKRKTLKRKKYMKKS